MFRIKVGGARSVGACMLVAPAGQSRTFARARSTVLAALCTVSALVVWPGANAEAGRGRGSLGRAFWAAERSKKLSKRKPKRADRSIAHQMLWGPPTPF